jgi:hypothetical protein
MLSDCTFGRLVVHEGSFSSVIYPMTCISGVCPASWHTSHRLPFNGGTPLHNTAGISTCRLTKIQHVDPKLCRCTNDGTQHCRHSWHTLRSNTLTMNSVAALMTSHITAGIPVGSLRQPCRPVYRRGPRQRSTSVWAPRDTR